MNPILITKQQLEDSKVGKFSVSGWGQRSNHFIVVNDTTFNCTLIEGDQRVYKIYGIKFSKNLSEQMYSNVLYENSSGVTSGTITFNDSYDNYDFFEIFYKSSGWGSCSSAYMSKRQLEENALITAWGQQYTSLSLVSSSTTQFTVGSSGLYILRVIGYKMAKGGYSGIVSDARMTVKSGSFTTETAMSRDSYKGIAITFDSPMPDTNYTVYTSIKNADIVAYWTGNRVSIEDKTVNGFTAYIYQDFGNSGGVIEYDWIAIRPNSYTREGMVEDVLFSNASGVNSGTINLSGNISDYDLIQVFTTSDNTIQGTHYQHDDCYLLTATDMLFTNQTDARVHYRGLGDSYILYNIENDNTMNIKQAQDIYITKITGIKFGRYVSGVAVDNTITSSGTGVPSTNAVYQALQNIPSGGGSGESSVTVDTAITQNSQNPVSSVGLYHAFEDILQTDSRLVDDQLYYCATKDAIIYTFQNKTMYKSNNIPAIIGIYNYQGWRNIMILSLSEDGAKVYRSNGDATFSTGTYVDSSRGVTWYYTSGNLGQGGVTSNYPYIKNEDDVNGWSASQIITQLLQEADPQIPQANYVVIDSVPTENSSNLVTSGGVYNALQNAGGGSSITVDSTITQGGTNPVEGGAIYTALGDKADKSTTYTKTEVDTAVASKGDVTTNTDQNITGTKTFVGSKKVGFKQSTSNDKLGFTLYGNTGTERGYLEFNPTNTVDGVAGLMTLGNYATSAASLTQVGFRRYSNISGESGAYNLLMPMVADARTPFSLTTSYQNFYLPLGFTDGTTTVKTAKSGLVDLSPLLASLEARIAALEGN